MLVCIIILLGYLPTVPRNLNYTYETQHNISNVVFVNVTWDTPEITYGGVFKYVVEYINNDSKVPVIEDTISVGNTHMHKHNNIVRYTNIPV